MILRGPSHRKTIKNNSGQSSSTESHRLVIGYILSMGLNREVTIIEMFNHKLDNTSEFVIVTVTIYTYTS